MKYIEIKTKNWQNKATEEYVPKEAFYPIRLQGNDCKDAQRTQKKNEHSERLEVSNKELENIMKKQTEPKNSITEIKGINSRLADTEEQISKLEDSVVKITQTEEKKQKEF